MKITEDHYQIIKEAITKTLKDKKKSIKEVVTYYEINKIGKDYKKRALFDLLYASYLNEFICSKLYEYCNDEHIYTAIKKVYKELESI